MNSVSFWPTAGQPSVSKAVFNSSNFCLTPSTNVPMGTTASGPNAARIAGSSSPCCKCPTIVCAVSITRWPNSTTCLMVSPSVLPNSRTRPMNSSEVIISTRPDASGFNASNAPVKSSRSPIFLMSPRLFSNPSTVFVERAAAPPKSSSSDLTMAIMAWSAGIRPFSRMAMISAVDLPKALARMASTEMPISVNCITSWPASLPRAWICPSASAMRFMASVDCPEPDA